MTSARSIPVSYRALGLEVPALAKFLIVIVTYATATCCIVAMGQSQLTHAEKTSARGKGNCRLGAVNGLKLAVNLC